MAPQIVHEPVLAANEPFFGVGDEALVHPSGISNSLPRCKTRQCPRGRASHAQSLALARPRFCPATLVLIAAAFEATADASIAPILIMLRHWMIIRYLLQNIGYLLH
jgi:hypothetical protein